MGLLDPWSVPQGNMLGYVPMFSRLAVNILTIKIGQHQYFIIYKGLLMQLGSSCQLAAILYNMGQYLQSGCNQNT